MIKKQETIEASKGAIKHWEENVKLMATAEGDFYNNTPFSHTCRIGETVIYYDSDNCALCELKNIPARSTCGTHCILGKLDLSCDDESRPWYKVRASQTKSDILKNSMDMLKLLRDTLEKIESCEYDKYFEDTPRPEKEITFEVGDWVRVMERDAACRNELMIVHAKFDQQYINLIDKKGIIYGVHFPVKVVDMGKITYKEILSGLIGAERFKIDKLNYHHMKPVEVE